MHLCTVAHMHNTAPPPMEIIPTAEAAQLLGVSVATVNRWAATGQLAVAIKTPGPRGANLFYRSDIVRRSQQKAKGPGSRQKAVTP